MNKEYLMRMPESELTEYARVLGIDVESAKTAAAKIELIEGRRSADARVSVLGMELAICKKRLHDKRVTDLASQPLTDATAEQLLGMVLGDEQMQEVVDACTDADGTVDNDALAHVYAKVLASPELKNF